MCIMKMKTGLRLLALGLAFIAFASPNYARAAGDKVSAARAAAIAATHLGPPVTPSE
jgi:hypothetical protein